MEIATQIDAGNSEFDSIPSFLPLAVKQPSTDRRVARLGNRERQESTSFRKFGDLRAATFERLNQSAFGQMP